MNKDHILAEIRRTAEENGGLALGKSRFLAETGIKEADWAGRWWTTWGDAVREAGLEPQRLNPKLDDSLVLEAAVSVVRKIGRFPKSNELRMACSTDPSLPSHNTFRRFGGLSGLRSQLSVYAKERGLSDITNLIGPPAEDLRSVSDEDAEPTEVTGDGFVYLIKAGKHYKIGKADSAEKRFRQLKIQLPDRAELVHRIKTDDAYGIERYWHQRFADKRLNGEWFALSAADVKVFRRRKFM